MKDDTNHDLRKRLTAMSSRLREHDQNFVDLGALYVEMNHKLNLLIQRTDDLPQMRADIAYLKIQVVKTDNNINKINERLIKMEAKDDYLLERIEKLDQRVDNMSRREYA